MVNVHVYSEKDNLPKRLGEYILTMQDEALKKHSHFNIAISGGSLNKVLNKALVQDKDLQSKISWYQMRVYFVDERLVPLDHPDSNYNGFKTEVLDHLTTKPRVYPINDSLLNQGETGYALIAQDYEGLLPDLDLILLGCGPDGHTCSLFPDEAHRYLIDERERKVMWCHDSPKPPSDRITVTMPAIEESRNICFVAEGDSKQDIMHEIFDLKNTKLPTALINKELGSKVEWFVDDKAFKKVQATSFD